MKDTAIVLTLTGYAIAFDGVLDDQRYNDRQDAKRRLQELYLNPPKRGHNLKVLAPAEELSND